MDKNEKIVALLTTYAVSYPHSKMDAGAMLIYSRALSCLEVVEIEAAMNKLIMTSKFFPSVAEIYQEVQSMRNYVKAKQGGKRVLTDAEAWADVMEVVKSHSIYSSEPWKFATPEVEKAARQFGLTELCSLQADNVGVARAQFTRFYNSVISKASDEAYNQQAIRMLGTRMKELLSKSKEVKKIEC